MANPKYLYQIADVIFTGSEKDIKTHEAHMKNIVNIRIRKIFLFSLRPDFLNFSAS